MATSNKLPLLVLGGVVVAIAAATFLLRGRGADPAPAADVAEAPAGAAPAAVTADPPRGGGPRPGASGAERVQAVTARREEMRARHAQQTEEMRQRAEKTFEGERVDPQWAPGKQRELDAITEQPAFETIGVTPSRLDVQCRSSMCRIEGDFASAGQADDWVLVYMSSVGSTMPHSIVSRVANPDGSTSVRIYGRGR